MRSSRQIIFALIFPVLLSGLLSAKEKPVRPEQDTLTVPVPSPLGSFDELERAQRWMRFGDFRRAAELLESLLEHQPVTPELHKLLTTCYERTKEYDKLIAFLKSRLENSRHLFAPYRDLGQAYIQAGMPDSAAAYFYMAVGFSADKKRGFAAIANIYHQSGYYNLEKEFIDSARILTGDPNLLAGHMGDVLAALQQFGAAAMEYLAYMEEDSIAAIEAEERLISLIRFPESVDTVITILAVRMASRIGTRQLQKIYGQLLMEQDRFDDAFDFFRGQDSLAEGNGGDILVFMQECNKRRRYEHALRAGDYFLQRHARSALKNGVLFVMAEGYIGTGQYLEALAAYESIAGDLIRPAHRAEAILSIGLLYKDHLNDLNKAKEYLNEVVRTVPGGSYAVLAQQALGDIAIRERHLEAAIGQYQSLLELELPPEIAEQIEFTLAEAYLFQEDYQEAASRFRQIISRYPRGFYVNDAIQYSLIIGETLDEAPGQIDLFASAEYFRYTRRPDSVEYYLNKICRIGIPSLAPASYLHLARLYAEQERYEEAVTAVDSLAALYPESYFLPYGLKLKADIYLDSPETREQALALYRDLLLQYATYPFAAEIREIIRREIPASRI